MNPEHIIISADQIAKNLYREGESDQVDRLAYQVGLLNGKIRELCQLLDNANDEIKQLQLDLDRKGLTMKYAIAIAMLALAGCSSNPIAAPNQELIVDKQVQPMGRNEVIDAVRQCETSGLRAIPLYAKRKIGGYTVETVVEVTCGPKYQY